MIRSSLLALLTLLFLTCTARAESLLLDDFDPAPDGRILTFAVQDDGTWLVAGEFTHIANNTRPGLARFLPDGSLDTDFLPDAIEGSIFSIVVLPDGKLMIGGNFTRIGGVARSGLARLHHDGSLDQAFPDLKMRPLTNHAHLDMVYRILRLRDGNLMVAGCFTDIAHSGIHALARLHPDGRIDPSFKPIHAQDINPRGYLWDVREQADGRLLLAGGVYQLHGVSVGHLARMHPDGNIDLDFSPSVRRPGGGGETRVVIEQDDGRILLAGRFDQIIGSGQSWNTPFTTGHLARLHADGSIDYGFSANGASANAGILWLELQSDQRILVSGVFNRVGTSPLVAAQVRDQFARFLPSGTPEPIPQPNRTGSEGNGQADTLTSLPDGRVLIGGNFSRLHGKPRRNLARFSPAEPLRGVTSMTLGHQTCVDAGTRRCWGTPPDDRHAPHHLLPPGSEATHSLATGYAHACALNARGGVLCWGDNTHGQLGDGNTTSRPYPTAVPGLDSGVIALTAGHVHTCAINASGNAYCWGRNANGQLGDGTTQQRLRPVKVSGLKHRLQAIHAGRFHTCSLDVTGAVYCWGGNRHGQLGDASTTDRPIPTPAHGLHQGTRLLATGEYHTCAVDADDILMCWGWNGVGQLGNGDLAPRFVPTPVLVPRP